MKYFILVGLILLAGCVQSEKVTKLQKEVIIDAYEMGYRYAINYIDIEKGRNKLIETLNRYFPEN